MAGTVQSVLVCVEAAETVSPCPAGQAPALISSYLPDPSAQSFFEHAIGSIDYASVAQYWSLAFGMVIFIYVVSRSYGSIIEAFRRI